MINRPPGGWCAVLCAPFLLLRLFSFRPAEKEEIISILEKRVKRSFPFLIKGSPKEAKGRTGEAPVPNPAAAAATDFWPAELKCDLEALHFPTKEIKRNKKKNSAPISNWMKNTKSHAAVGCAHLRFTRDTWAIFDTVLSLSLVFSPILFFSYNHFFCVYYLFFPLSAPTFFFLLFFLPYPSVCVILPPPPGHIYIYIYTHVGYLSYAPNKSYSTVPLIISPSPAPSWFLFLKKKKKKRNLISFIHKHFMVSKNQFQFIDLIHQIRTTTFLLFFFFLRHRVWIISRRIMDNNNWATAEMKSALNGWQKIKYINEQLARQSRQGRKERGAPLNFIFFLRI